MMRQGKDLNKTVELLGNVPRCRKKTAWWDKEVDDIVEKMRKYAMRFSEESWGLERGIIGKIKE